MYPKPNPKPSKLERIILPPILMPQYPIWPISLVQLRLCLQCKRQSIGGMLKCQIKRIPLRGDFIPRVIGITSSHDVVVYILGFFHVGGAGFPEGGGALYVGVDYGDGAGGVGHVFGAVDGGGTEGLVSCYHGFVIVVIVVWGGISTWLLPR